MVMPRSFSISIVSRTCSVISRSARPPVIWMMRSASVDLPWSMWAMMEKFLILFRGVMARAFSRVALNRQWIRPAPAPQGVLGLLLRPRNPLACRAFVRREADNHAGSYPDRVPRPGGGAPFLCGGGPAPGPVASGLEGRLYRRLAC